MVAILKARNISRMQTLLRAEGIVEEADGSEKFNKTKHAELWNTYCLAWLQEPEVETGDLITNCTCWLNCSRGHCIHRYVIREWFGHPIPQPPALTIEAFRGKSAAEALAVSEEEDCPRRHASRASQSSSAAHDARKIRKWCRNCCACFVAVPGLMPTCRTESWAGFHLTDVGEDTSSRLTS